MNIEMQIAQLQKQNAQMRFLVFFLFVVVICGCIVGASTNQPDGSELTVRRLNVVDEDGKVRATLSASRSFTALGFRTWDGQELVRLSILGGDKGAKATSADLTLKAPEDRDTQLPGGQTSPSEISLHAARSFAAFNASRRSDIVHIKVDDAPKVAILRENQELATFGVSNLVSQRNGDKTTTAPTLILFDKDGVVRWKPSE